MLAPLLVSCSLSDQLMKRLAARRYAGLLILSPPAAAAADPATTHPDPQSQTADCSQVEENGVLEDMEEDISLKKRKTKKKVIPTATKTQSPETLARKLKVKRSRSAGDDLQWRNCPPTPPSSPSS
ncbi:hypothetical protein J4Q44_G00238130 [Coregonus suidteri]|uniref:Uncharacterized protein n=1 Tax=Coregonus suidteri TaxID=861788 RepID=A0AAN8L8V0_9TELE